MRSQRAEETRRWTDELDAGRPRFRHRQWVAVLVLVLVLALSGLAGFVPKLFSGGGVPAELAEGRALVEAELARLAERVEAWSVAHGGALPESVLRLEEEEGERWRDPWGRPYVLETLASGRAFRLVALGPDGLRGRDDLTLERPRPLVLTVGLVDGAPRFALGARDTASEEELERWLRELLDEQGPDAALSVVAPRGTPRELSGRAADVALRAGFGDVGFADLAR